MSDLSKHIQNELTAILHKIEATPPKRCTSLQKIKTLVEQAPLTSYEKTTINRSIRKIESAMANTQNSFPGHIKSNYAKNLFYENMFLEEKNMNKEHLGSNHESEADHYGLLLEKLEEVRKTRLKREQYLGQLIIKFQRMKRLVQLKVENQEKYLRSKKLQEEGQRKKLKEEELKQQVNSMVKRNKVRSVYSLVSKYNNMIG